MSFNPRSLKRLQELGRQLPKEINKTEASLSQKSKKPEKRKLHSVETEENPEQLFRELIDISPDGNIPDHLLDRLKKLESNRIEIPEHHDLKNTNNSDDLSTEKSSNPYTTFQKLLLEDDI